MQSNDQFKVRVAQSNEDLSSFQCLAREYISWLGEDLSYQQVEEELAQLACYAAPSGCILLARKLSNTTPNSEEHSDSLVDQHSTCTKGTHRNNRSQAADIGIVGIRRLVSTADTCLCAQQNKEGKVLLTESSLDNSMPDSKTVPASDATMPGSASNVGQTVQHQQGCHVCLPCCEMKRLYVAPEHQGQGVGRALVNAAVKQAYNMGYRYMVLDTLERLSAANRIYESEGFERIPAYYASLEDAVFWGKRL